MRYTFEVEEIEPVHDELLGADASALIVAVYEDGKRVRIAAFLDASSARASVRMRAHAKMLGDTLVQMADTIEALESTLRSTESTAEGLKSERDKLYEVINERKMQARGMARSALESILIDDVEDHELRERLQRVLKRFGG